MQYLVRVQTACDGEKLAPILYYTIADARKFSKNPPLLAANVAHLVWLSGLPAPEWFNVISAQYCVDPELFSRYLNFLQNRENCEVTTMPSSTERMITLRLTTICRRPIALTRSAI